MCSHNPAKLVQKDDEYFLKLGKSSAKRYDAEEIKVSEFLLRKSQEKGGLGALWWKMTKANPAHIQWATSGPDALSKDQCVVV